MLKIAGSSDAAVKSVAQSAVVQSALLSSDASRVDIGLLDRRIGVRAHVEEQVACLFGKLLSLPSTTLIVSAKAQIVGTTRLCMLAMDGKAKGTLHLEKKAQVTATDCSLYLNSSSPQGLRGKDGAMAKALSICAVGGFDGAKATSIRLRLPTAHHSGTRSRIARRRRRAPRVVSSARLPIRSTRSRRRGCRRTWSQDYRS